MISSKPKEHVNRALSVKFTACRFASALVGHCNSGGWDFALVRKASSWMRGENSIQNEAKKILCSYVNSRTYFSYDGSSVRRTAHAYR
jgi:hypothetical protein